MKERPILFSAPMVKAILSGSKTMTRRVVKQDREGLLDCRPTPAWDAFWKCVACPYGQPGDRLWVRETWAAIDGVAVRYVADNVSRVFPVSWPQSAAIHGLHARHGNKRRPSIHMPRWASRILLEITDVRVERAQDISEDDARAEGIAYSERFEGYCTGEAEHFNSHDPRQSYFSLWEAINGAGSVAANPWVWVVEFKRIDVAEGS